MLQAHQVGKTDLIVQIVNDIGVDTVESSLVQVLIGDMIEHIAITVKVLYQQLQQPFYCVTE